MSRARRDHNFVLKRLHLGIAEQVASVPRGDVSARIAEVDCSDKNTPAHVLPWNGVSSLRC